LIRRKCSEEGELYKVQLLNATQTIEELERKLNEYQIRRQNIADNLHSIMESQWKKILDVLTCPSRMTTSNFDSNEVSESDNNRQFYNNNDQHMMNNLSRSEENLKAELLRNYIDKLLRQPPKSLPKSTDENSTKTARSRSTKTNKPWKPS
jgi:glutamyl-tRNA reductase